MRIEKTRLAGLGGERQVAAHHLPDKSAANATAVMEWRDVTSGPRH